MGEHVGPDHLRRSQCNRRTVAREKKTFSTQGSL